MDALVNLQANLGGVDPTFLAMLLQTQNQQLSTGTLGAEVSGQPVFAVPPVVQQSFQDPSVAVDPRTAPVAQIMNPALAFGSLAAPMPQLINAGLPADVPPQREIRRQPNHDIVNKVVEPPQRVQCHLHTKPKKTCKFCQRSMEKPAATNKEPVAPVERMVARSAFDQKIEQPRLIAGNSFGITPILLSHITGSAHYKESLSLETFDALIGEMREYGDSIAPYMANSSTTPSALFCCMYRLFTFGIDASQLMQLLELEDAPLVRCVGLLYVRFGLPPTQLWPWLGEYILDTEVFTPVPGSSEQTIGEFVESLLTEDRYYSISLPRIPMSTKRQLEAKLAPISQYRQRAQANLDYVDVYRDGGIAVEINQDGEWLAGVAQTFIDDRPWRPKIQVRLHECGSEVEVPLGKVIITDRHHASSSSGLSSRTGRRSRSRSPGKFDLVRERGRSDADLLNELRSRDRERATTSGKDYAKRPLGLKASLAMALEMGAASTKLAMEDTFVSDHRSNRPRSRRSPSPQEQSQKPVSAERRAQMQQLFEKYSIAKPSEVPSSHRDDSEGPAFMRFG